MTGPIARVLACYPAESRPLSTPIPLGNAGGLSGSKLWRFQAGRGPMVLRAWPVDGPDREGLRRIHDWLRNAGDLGFLPIPIPSLDARTVLDLEGRLWDLAPWLPGEADPGRPPPPGRLQSMFAALAAFHARVGTNPTVLASPGLIRRAEELRGLVLGEFDVIALTLDRAPFDPRVDLARRWLAHARRLAPSLLEPLRRAASLPMPIQPCLRDARANHFLFEGDRLTGLVDFGAMGLDTVAGDLARLLVEAVGPARSSRLEALRVYEAIRPLQPLETAAIAHFERASLLLGPAHWVRWHFLEAKTFDDPEAVLQGLARGLARIQENPSMLEG